MSRSVVVVQRVLKHYRIEFFERLRRQLAASDIDLRVLFGQSHDQALLRQDEGSLAWAERIDNRYVGIGPRQLVWQPCLGALRGTDLVIVEQASRLLVNYPLLALQHFGGPKVAWWGHGANIGQGLTSFVGEAAKRRTTARSTWWFCYTEGVADLVADRGFPRERITVVQNAIDTKALRTARQRITPRQVQYVREELGIGRGPVGVWLSSLCPLQRPGFLIEAVDYVRDLLPDFEIIVIGDGPDRFLFDNAKASRPWLHVLGFREGDELVRLLSPASVVLNPGLVGLAVLDGFALGLPMVTCESISHSPEFEYLKHGVNGLVLPEASTPRDFASEVSALLLDIPQLDRLSDGARADADLYTIDAMVDRFSSGIVAALSASR